MNQISYIAPVNALPGYQASDLNLVSKLYLGASIPGGGLVDDDTFDAWVDDAVACLFPDGWTVTTGQGAWRCQASRKTIRETVRVLEVAHDRSGLERVALVAEAYKVAFDQQAVLVSTTQALNTLV